MRTELDDRVASTGGSQFGDLGWVTSALIYSAIERNRRPRRFNTSSEIVDLLNIDARKG